MSPTSSPVCVTGASGFIASWVVRGLLERGYTVHGTVRDPDKKSAHLTALPGAPERLRLFRADLVEPGSFAAAIAGCGAVLHTASPYVINVRDPQRELVEPALAGTRNVLESCAATPTVKRVIVTSSMAAITDEPPAGHVLTGDDWNTKSTLHRNPYHYSKTLAERAAWEFARQPGVGFSMAAINPFFVAGPALSAEINATNQILVDVVKGVYPGIMSLHWGLVDVRDVAEGHIRAMERPEANGRYLLANDAVPMRDLVAWMRESGFGGPDYKLPTTSLDNAAGDLIVRLASYFQPKGVGQYLRTNIGRIPRYDTTKTRTELSLELRPPRQVLRDALDDLRRWGHL